DGQVLALSSTPDISEENPAWSPDGERLAYTVKPKNSSSYEIDVMEIATHHVVHLTSNTPGGLSNGGVIWSRDGKHIVFTQQAANEKDSNIFLTPSEGGTAVNLTPHRGENVFTATDLSPDGKTLLLTSDFGNGYLNAALLDVAGKKITWLTNDKWEV